MLEKQVKKSHYDFRTYVSKKRLATMWHQLDEVLGVNPDSVIEVGPGPGVFKSLAGLFGVKVETVDLDPDLMPDHVAAAENLPFDENSFDVACAFQMLEHVPYQTSLDIVRELSRVTKRHVIISLPDARPLWLYSLHIPGLGERSFLLPKPWFGPREHVFDGQHYWEINKKGYTLGKVSKELESVGSMKLERSYRVHESAYHRFFVFRKDKTGSALTGELT